MVRIRSPFRRGTTELHGKKAETQGTQTAQGKTCKEQLGESWQVRWEKQILHLRCKSQDGHRGQVLDLLLCSPREKGRQELLPRPPDVVAAETSPVRGPVRGGMALCDRKGTLVGREAGFKNDRKDCDTSGRQEALKKQCCH